MKAQTIIAVGSASAVDLGKGIVQRHDAELIAVPTTLGGSEMTRVYGAQQKNGLKRGGAGPGLLPRVVCYDPETLRSLPVKLLVASGVNAWAHAIEALYARREHWIGKAAAQSAGRALPSLLQRADQAAENRTLQTELFEAACQAGFALNACGMGLHHAVCHVLGGLTGIEHSLLNFVVLPAAVEVNLRRGAENVASAMRKLDADIGSVIGSYVKSFDMPRSLQDLGVGLDRLDQVIPAVMAAPHIANNPVSLRDSDVKDALTIAYHGAAVPE